MLLLQELAPRHAQIHATLNLFPGLTALDLSGMPCCCSDASSVASQAMTAVGLVANAALGLAARLLE